MDIREEGDHSMHEVAVMQGVVKTILQSLAQAGASRVTNVQLAIYASHRRHCRRLYRRA